MTSITKLEEAPDYVYRVLNNVRPSVYINSKRKLVGWYISDLLGHVDGEFVTWLRTLHEEGTEVIVVNMDDVDWVGSITKT